MERAADTFAPDGATGPQRAPAPASAEPPDRLKERLRRRARELGLDEVGFTGADALPRADYVERWLAEGRAGVGWIGKNTLIVHPTLGCYTLLGLILWTGELPPDPPAVDQCGRCRRCLDACPTGALDAAYQMDARRCLSYVTIEQRGPIAPEFREALSLRAFGCDACLAACPFGGARLFEDAPLLPTDRSLAGASLRELLERARDRFWKSFRATPIERARRRGFLRSLLIAAGNAGDPELRDVVMPFAEDADTLLAEHARWALQRIDGRQGD